MATRDYRWMVDTPNSLRGWALRAGLLLALLVLLHWSAGGAQLSWGELAAGLPQIGDFISRSLPPDPAILPRPLLVVNQGLFYI